MSFHQQQQLNHLNVSRSASVPVQNGHYGKKSHFGASPTTKDNEPTSPLFRKVAVEGLPRVVSQVVSLKEEFIWEIQGVAEIQKSKQWGLTYCEMSLSNDLYKWGLTLGTSSSGKYLLAKPELIHSKAPKPVAYQIRFSVINNDNFAIYTSPYCQETIVNVGEKTTPAPNRGPVSEGATEGSGYKEVLAFTDGIVDSFSNYVFNNSLKLLVEIQMHVVNNV